MNIELWKSYILKVLPAVIAYVVGRGWLPADVADSIPQFVDWIFVGLVLIPTLWRSWQNYKR